MHGLSVGTSKPLKAAPTNDDFETKRQTHEEIDGLFQAMAMVHGGADGLAGNSVRRRQALT
jgi:hypothetical protein